MEIQYDGSRFSGWQRQAGQVTVQGELERVLSVLCAKPVQINGASRTDAGVHAEGQVASLLGDFAIPTGNIQRAANNLLPDDISIRRVWEADIDFHPRFDSKGKTYRYRILNSKAKDPFKSRYSWWVDRPLDIQAMSRACSYFIGQQDFAAFESARAQNTAGTVREIFDLRIEREGQELIIWIEGNAFLYNMVRIITGTLFEIGIGQKKPDQVPDIINGRDHNKAGLTAPPEGLCLVQVHFDP